MLENLVLESVHGELELEMRNLTGEEKHTLTVIVGPNGSKCKLVLDGKPLQGIESIDVEIHMQAHLSTDVDLTCKFFDVLQEVM